MTADANACWYLVTDGSYKRIVRVGITHQSRDGEQHLQLVRDKNTK
jgi:hypothetical protein